MPIGMQDKTQSLRIEALEDAAAEAVRFIERADLAIADLKAKSSLDRSLAFSAAKRASLDLSRSLTIMRGTRWA